MAKNTKNTNTTSPALTVVQVKLIEAILNSEFHAVPMADRADAPIWFNTAVQSPSDVSIFKELKKAGLVNDDTTSKDVNEHTCCVTTKGFEAFTHAKTPTAAPVEKVEAKKADVADVKDPVVKGKNVEKKTAERKNPAKPTGGLGVAETWMKAFRANEAAWAAKKTPMTDEEITKFMNDAFPGRNSAVFGQVRLVRTRCNTQTCPGVQSWVKGEEFHRYIKHTDGKFYRATQRGVALDASGKPLQDVAAVVAPVVEPKAKKTVKAKAEVAPVVAPKATKATKTAPAAKKMVIKKAAKK